MKYFLLHLVGVLIMASTLHDLQQVATRSLWSEDGSRDSKHGNGVGENSVGMLMTGVSAAPKRPQRSKLIFQIMIDTSDPKKKRGRKRKGKKSVRANRRKIITNRRKSTNNRQKQLDSRRRHRNHYHTLRKEYNKKLKALRKHGNHYHKRRPKNDLFRKCCQRAFGTRKDMTFKRRYGLKKPSRRRPSSKYIPWLTNSRRSKQIRRQNHGRRKTPIRKNNRQRRPAASRGNQGRRSRISRRKHSSRRKGIRKKKNWQTNPRRGKKPKKIKAVAFFLRENKKDRKSRRTKSSRNVYS